MQARTASRLLPHRPGKERAVLVLTRHVHQSIVIGHDVVVTVLEVRGDQVRLGITAPKEVQVHREEVFAALMAANREAAASVVELDVLSELAARGLAAKKPLGGPRRDQGQPSAREAQTPGGSGQARGPAGPASGDPEGGP